MKRPYLPAWMLVAVAAFVLPGIGHARDRDRFQLVEATIADIQHAFRSGTLTPEELVRMYLARIAAYDQAGPQLNSFMHVSEHALYAARALNVDDLDDDGRRKPLFGVPVILKDNIDTADMPTTAGSIALGGSIPAKDAFITKKLRRAGALILGKATLTEFANFLSSTGMPTGYSSQLRLQLFERGDDLTRAGYGFNPFDPRTDPRQPFNDGRPALTPGKCFSDYTRFLKRNALRGARIAVPHFGYWTDSLHRVVLSVEQQQVMNDAIAVLRAEGAIVEDFHEIPTQEELFNFGGCGGLPIPANCSTVLLFGFKRDLNAYLAELPAGTPVRTLGEVIVFNNNFTINGLQVGLKYGQGLAIAADSLDTRAGSSDTARYLSDRAKDLDIAKTRGLDVVYKDFDAVLFPANRGANAPARAGFPSIVVPAGFVPNPAVAPPPFLPPTPFPDGFDAKPAPYGVTFSGPAFSEPKLIGFAYAFEQATQHRRPPESAPPLPTGGPEE